MRRNRGFPEARFGRRAGPPVIDQVTLAREQLRHAGADPDLPHETRHFVYVPGVAAAQKVAKALRSPGREIEIDTSARKGQWLVVVIQRIAITPAAIDDLRKELETAVDLYGGEYDRWQVDIANG